MLAPNGAWQEVKQFGGSKNNYILFNNATTWMEGFASFRAVKAEHSDEYAIGIIISAENKNYYITGDTLYNERIFESLPDIPIETVFLPVNGKGNNMNFLDAEKFAARIKAKYSIPIHIGMFDEPDGRGLLCYNKIIPVIYEEILFN